MEQTIARPRVLARRPLTALRQVHLAALAGIVLACIYLQVFIVGVMLPPAMIFGGITLAVMGLVVTGWRWAPLLGAAWALLLLAANTDVLTYYLGHPHMAHEFVFHLVLVALGVVGAVSGAATIRESAGRSSTPHWLWPFVGTVGLLVLGAAAATMIPRSAVAAGVSPATVAGLPVLKAGNYAFDRNELRVRAGEVVALRLENTDRGVHAFDIDELGVHVSIGGGTSSFAYFQPTTPGTYTFYCGVPHHEAMRGTLVVEP